MYIGIQVQEQTKLRDKLSRLKSSIQEKHQEYGQYYYTFEQLMEITSYARGEVVCLCDPTIAAALLLSHYQDGSVLTLDIDERWIDAINSITKSLNREDSKAITYDLARGLHSTHRANTTALAEYEYSADTLFFDPPFNMEIAIIAKNINALLKWDEEATAYVGYPSNAIDKLSDLLDKVGISVEVIDYHAKYDQLPPMYQDGSGQSICLLRCKRSVL